MGLSVHLKLKLKLNEPLGATVDIHGEVAREQYTGSYNRQCWGLDPLSISWASPYAGQHERYMPEYHKVHGNHIFVGEHTSVNHAWIFSALESGVRGVVQLLLEDGLVDEAKQIVDKCVLPCSRSSSVTV